MEKDRIVIGKIVNVHGIKGELKLFPVTDKPAQFQQLERVFVNMGGIANIYEVAAVRLVKNTVLLKLKGINDRNAAERFRDASIEIEQTALPGLPDDEYYVFDLLHMSVYDEEGVRIGTITNVLETGSNDCYNIKREDGTEFYLPALKTVVLHVDVTNKKMVVRIPDGLLD